MTAWLTRIPLALRVTVYGTGFLALVLGVLPYLFDRLMMRFPALKVDIGSLRIVGGVLAVVGLLLYLWSASILVLRGKGGHVEFDPPTQLVLSGPYRHVRNPVVACLLATMLGEAIAFSSTGIFIMFCLAGALAHAQVLLVEEPRLRRRYGQTYEEYCSRVSRWLPPLHR